MHVEEIRATEEDGAAAIGGVIASVRRLGEVQALALAVATSLTLLTITLTGIVVRPLAAVALLVLVTSLVGWAVVARWRRLRAGAARRREALLAEVADLKLRVQRFEIERRALRAELAAERARRESDRVERARSGSGSDRRLRLPSDSDRVARPLPQKVALFARAR